MDVYFTFKAEVKDEEPDLGDLGDGLEGEFTGQWISDNFDDIQLYGISRTPPPQEIYP